MSRYAAAFANSKGPGDSRPTALQIVEDEGVVGKLLGKTALITGANQGIGLETARALHATGITLYITARDATKGKQTVESIKSGPGPKSDAPVHVLELQLDSLESVRAAAKAFLDDNSKLNILILNAGIMATPYRKTKDGFESQFGTNHLGHFLLLQMLTPALLAASTPEFQSRVVSLSSSGHRVGGVRFHDLNFEKEAYDPWVAYGQSKTANIYLANEVERRYGNQGLHALSVHPGMILTNLGSHLPADSINFTEQMKRDLKNPPQGAATTIVAAISKEWEGRGGKYLKDCTEDGPEDPEVHWSMADRGYASWAFDEAAAKELWETSLNLVGSQ
ncbi:unnamed protein product [Clonostachys rosea]|uniref:WW domain-containing oxidoreductase n=1 Tax=Bionectria ochroleuca TaxID=29856 RepID=A0ABY6ULE2_BIOOC|nr:unnamed protein product [Clonostachys rosea]